MSTESSAAAKLLLNEFETRALGALIEKEITTPEYYPLSLNALTNACNQINNRDPVVVYGEQQVLKAVESLRDKRLATAISGGDSRVVKYGHKAAETLALPRPEIAVLCVLLLRGPQTVGELRTRTGRMHEFASLADVFATIQTLATRPVPLVTVLPRQAGTKEPRYAHLLANEVVITPSTTEPPFAPLSPAGPDRIAQLETELATLRNELADLRQQFTAFRKQLE
jgi:uncharacterized protein YceH (UPF0502 family)